VRVVDAIPVTATGKVNRNPLRDERWDTTDELWWRPDARAAAFRRFTQDDAAALRQEFAANGREAMLV
jgi:fatty-acyl-CoA synthase